MRFVLAIAFMFWSSFGFSVGVPTISGNMPRSTTPDSFTFKVTITGVSEAGAGLGTGSADVLFSADRLQIFLTKKYATTSTDFVNCGTGDFVAKQTNSAPEVTGSVTAGYTVVYSIKVEKCKTATIAEQFVSTDSKSIALKAAFRESKTGAFSTSEEKTLIALASIPSDAPTLGAISTNDHSITVNFTASTTPTYEDGQQRETSNVTVFAIDIAEIQANTSRFYLPTKVLNKNAATDDTASGADQCTYVMNNDTCMVCSKANSYIDASLVDTNYIKVATKATSATTAAFANLTNGKQYAVFMTYENGSKPTTCKLATPQETFSYSQNQGEEEKASDPKCFIATAAYGTPWHPNINLFRWFRDNVLLKVGAGEKFVEYYYEYSPPAAKFISEHPNLAAVVAGLLWIPASLVFVLKALVSNPKFLAGTIILAIAFASVWMSRRRRLRA